MSAPVPPPPWVEAGADAICGHVRSRATTPHNLYCPDCERTALTVLRAALPLIDAMGASGIRAERQVVAELRAKVEALPAEHHYGKTDCVGRADVLALIDGSSNE